MIILRCLIIYHLMLSNNVTIAKVRNISMLQLGSPPDMNEMLPNEEPPKLWDYTEPLVTRKTTLENFPNPFTNPVGCNRIDVQESYVCDPDKLLRKSEANRIDELLLLQRHNSNHHCEALGDVPFKMGVALINHIPKEDMNTLAQELLERWKLDHDKCNDGILLLFVKQEETVVIKWSKAVEPYINAKVVSSIYPICNKMLHDEKIAVAVDKCVSFVIKRIIGAILPSEETPQMLVTLVIATVIGIIYIFIIVSALADLQPNVN